MSNEQTIEQQLKAELGFIPSSGGYEPVPEGDYEGVVHAIIKKGRQVGFEGKGTSSPILLLLELPEVTFTVDSEERAKIVRKNINLGANIEKGGFSLFLQALGRKPTSATIMQAMTDAELKQLLGLSTYVTVEHKLKENGKVREEIKLSKRQSKTAPTFDVKLRAPLFFNPRFPDLEVFKKLNYYTQKDIMSALDADQFPKELHAAWAKAQEEQAAKEGGKFQKEEPFVADNYNTESIE